LDKQFFKEFIVLKKIPSCVLILLFTLPVLAKPIPNYKGEIIPCDVPSWLHLGVYGGYGNVSGAYENDGQFTQGRLALSAEGYNFQAFSLGLETGVQWGNDMRFVVPDFFDFSPGGLPVQTTLKPLVDLLVSLKFSFGQSSDFSVFAKGGIAYRQLQFMDRTSDDDTLRKINGELQAGLGYNVTRHAMLTAFYQGIYSGNSANITVDADNNVKLGRIPTQQAGFLGVNYAF